METEILSKISIKFRGSNVFDGLYYFGVFENKKSVILLSIKIIGHYFFEKKIIINKKFSGKHSEILNEALKTFCDKRFLRLVDKNNDEVSKFTF